MQWPFFPQKKGRKSNILYLTCDVLGCWWASVSPTKITLALYDTVLGVLLREQKSLNNPDSFSKWTFAIGSLKLWIKTPWRDLSIEKKAELPEKLLYNEYGNWKNTSGLEFLTFLMLSLDSQMNEIT